MFTLSKTKQAEVNALQQQLEQAVALQQQLAQASEQANRRVKEVTAELNQLKGISQALDRSMAVIQFDTQGHITTANDNFLKTVGYSLREIEGKHHRMFCDEQF